MGATGRQINPIGRGDPLCCRETSLAFTCDHPLTTTGCAIHDLPPRRSDAVAAELGPDPARILPLGRFIARIPVDELRSRQRQPEGKFILVIAVPPTRQGDGKTTTIGLADTLRHLGKRSTIAVREPSPGRYSGIEGDGTAAGRPNRSSVTLRTTKDQGKHLTTSRPLAIVPTASERCRSG